MREYQVVATWDPDAELYVAKAEGFPGFILSARTPDEIVRKVRLALPAFIETGVDFTDRIRLKFDRDKSERIERLAA